MKATYGLFFLEADDGGRIQKDCRYSLLRMLLLESDFCLCTLIIDVLIQHRLLVFPRQIKNSTEDSRSSKKYCKIRMLEPCHLMKRFPCTIPGILGILLCRRNISTPYLAASKPVRTWEMLGIIELTLASHRSPPTYTHRLTL